MSLATSCLSRRIRIVGGERTFYLKPPTIRQVVEILHVMEELQDPSDYDLLFELIASLHWHKTVDQVVLIRNLFGERPKDFQSFIRQLILQGYNPDRHSPSKDPSSETNIDSKKKPLDWKALISDYCRVYPGRDPYQVYNETPFPFFMEWLTEVKREQARQNIYGATIAQFSFGGNEKQIKIWRERAYPTTAEEEKSLTDDMLQDIDPEEYRQNLQNFKNELTS